MPRKALATARAALRFAHEAADECGEVRADRAAGNLRATLGEYRPVESALRYALDEMRHASSPDQPRDDFLSEVIESGLSCQP